MKDKVKDAYESSKNIYDDVLTQSNIFSRLYIKLFWNGTDDNVIEKKYSLIFLMILMVIFLMFQ